MSSKVKPDFVTSGDDLPFLRASSFDYLVAKDLLEHLDNPIKGLIEWRRIVKYKGKILVVVPDFRKVWFDKRKRRTTLGHVLRDFKRDAKQTRPDKHAHRWILEDLVALMKHVGLKIVKTGQLNDILFYVVGEVSKPTVTAWLRVKDEAVVIEETLRSVGMFADDIVVLDTGSTDDTERICRADPQVKTFLKWDKDFYHEALDRDVALALARTTGANWLLQLDADEIFEDDLRREIMDLLEQNKFDAWRFRLFDFRFNVDDKKEAKLVSPLEPNRKYCEPFFRRRISLYRSLDTLGIKPFVPHHGVLPQFPDYRIGDAASCTKHYGLSITIESFEQKKERYVNRPGEPYVSEWKKARAFIPGKYLVTWQELKKNSFEQARQVHLGSNIMKRDVNDREKIVSEVW